MNIDIYGMGYVGLVTAAHLANWHKVRGVEVSTEKIKQIQEGQVPFYEPGLEELLEKNKSNFSVVHQIDVEERGDVSIVCVGTPLRGGSLYFGFVKDVLQHLNDGLYDTRTHTVIIRSTLKPGMCKWFNQSFDNLDIVFYPEFLREGCALQDIKYPGLDPVGYHGKDKLPEEFTNIFQSYLQYPYEDVEMVKMTCNAWHATKIVFANEISRICDSVGADSRQVMQLFCEDKKLNISKAYLKPGFAYGGSCLPKDVEQINQAIDATGYAPMLRSLKFSNNQHVSFTGTKISELLSEHNVDKVILLGIAFKAHTDDLRNSAVVSLIKEIAIFTTAKVQV